MNDQEMVLPCVLEMASNYSSMSVAPLRFLELAGLDRQNRQKN